ncbi:MAG: YfhO family protein [Eubacteriales bacterium]
MNSELTRQESTNASAGERQTMALPLLLSFGLSVLCLLLTFWGRGLLLRGDASLLSLDMQSLAAKIAALKTDGFPRSLFVYLGDFSQGLPSPFTLLAAWLPFSVTTSLLFVLILRGGLLGVAFALYLWQRGVRQPLSLSAFAVLYALSAYALLGGYYPAAADLLLFLPLVCVGIDALITRRRFLLLTLSLGASLLLYCPGGYVLLLAALAYFLYAYIGVYHPTPKKFGLTALLFGGSLLGGVLIGLPAWLPRLQDFSFDPVATGNVEFDLLSLLAKLMPGAYDGLGTDSAPWVYCGMAVLLLVPVFFAAKQVSLREKITSAILLVLLIWSMQLTILNQFIHIFGTDGAPVFLQTPFFCFLLLTLACRGLCAAEGQENRYVFLSAGFVTLLLVFMQKMEYTYLNRQNQPVAVLSDTASIWPALFILLGLTFFLSGVIERKADGKTRRTFAVALLLVVAFESSFAGFKLIKHLYEQEGYVARQTYERIFDSYRSGIAYIRESDDGLYRIEKGRVLTSDDPYLFGTYDVASAASAALAEQVWGKLGYAGSTNTVHFSAALDSLLGVKYLVLDKDPAPDTEQPPESNKKQHAFIKQMKQMIEFKSYAQNITPRPVVVSPLYELVHETDTYLIYENPYAQPLLFTVPDSLSEFDFSVPSEDDIVYDPTTGEFALSAEWADRAYYIRAVERINALFAALSGEASVSLFTPIHKTLTLQNTQDTVDEFGQIKYSVFSEAMKASSTVSFSFAITAATQVVCDFSALIPREAEVHLNYQKVGTLHEGGTHGHGLLNLGTLSPGGYRIDIYYGTNPDGTFYLMDGTDYIFAVNETAFASLLPSPPQEETGMVLHSLDRRHINLTLTAEADRLTVMSTIPYDEGWQVTVDGEAVPSYAALDALLAFDLPGAGEYEIALSYRPPRHLTPFLAPLLTSLVAIALCAVLRFLEKKANPTMQSQQTKE